MSALEHIRLTLNDYFKSKPIEKAWVFGSYARGDETSDSDIDILVDYGRGRKPSLFKIACIKGELEALFDKKIDLVPEDCLYEDIRKYVDRDKILIYERI